MKDLQAQCKEALEVATSLKLKVVCLENTATEALKQEQAHMQQISTLKEQVDTLQATLNFTENSMAELENALKEREMEKGLVEEELLGVKKEFEHVQLKVEQLTQQLKEAGNEVFRVVGLRLYDHNWSFLC